MLIFFMPFLLFPAAVFFSAGAGALLDSLQFDRVIREALNQKFSLFAVQEATTKVYLQYFSLCHTQPEVVWRQSCTQSY